jgi:hypothetical protein
MSSSNSLFIGKVANLPKSLEPKRAGLIPYTIYNNQTFLAFGIDTRSRDITDFAGGVNKTEKLVDAALREGKEETLNLISLERKDVSECLCISNNRNLSIFVPVNQVPYKFAQEFSRRYKAECNSVHERKRKYRPEVCEIVWFSLPEFKKRIAYPGAKDFWYSRTRNFLLDFGYEKIASHIKNVDQTRQVKL